MDEYSLYIDNLPGVVDFGIDEIENDGLYDSEVNIALNEVPWLKFKGEQSCGNGTQDGYLACMKRNNAILVDDWSAVGPESVENRVRELIPLVEQWEVVADGLDAVVDPPVTLELFLTQDGYKPFDDVKDIDKAPGYVVPELVPQRNLGSYEDEGIEDSP